MNGFQSFRAKFGAAAAKAVLGESMWHFAGIELLSLILSLTPIGGIVD